MTTKIYLRNHVIATENFDTVWVGGGKTATFRTYDTEYVNRYLCEWEWVTAHYDERSDSMRVHIDKNEIVRIEIDGSPIYHDAENKCNVRGYTWVN